MRKAGQITLILFIFLLHIPSLQAQNRKRAQMDIILLAGDSMYGRGYVDQGDHKAAQYISDRMEEIGLHSYRGSYFQPFDLSVNTIPTAQLIIDDQTMEAGIDFMVSPDSRGTELEGKVFPISMKMLHSKSIGKKAYKAVRKGWVPVIPVVDPNDSLAQWGIQEILRCVESKALIFLKESLVWSVARQQSEHCHIWMLESSFDPFSENISLKIESEWIEEYKSQNVMGWIPGTEHPDSFVILCGHYDHLGMMGDAVFYGANDNASGIAMMLDLATQFVEEPQAYSLLFIGFGGEEAGLVGSKYFVEHPPEGMSLDQIKFVFNMDLMGNGQEGATIVNGKVYPAYYDLFVELNEKGDYLPKIKARGKAANSDHFFFSEAGIPSFFIYLMGPYTHYHIPLDNAQELILGEYYDRSYKLIADFILALNALN